MNDPERFLTRWSRRKRKAAEPSSDSTDASQRDAEQIGAHPRESGDPGPEPRDSRLRGNKRSVSEASQGTPQQTGSEQNKTTEPEFDLSKLPPIESITAETDIRPFLASAVPEALRQAALRRAWAVDPKIRDFIGLAENQWDFNAPGVPGFDLSPPTGDIKRMVAEIFGEKPNSDSQPADPQPEAAREPVPPALSQNIESGARQVADDATPPGETHMQHREAASDSQRTSASQALPAEHGTTNTAAQQKNATQKDEAPPSRLSHGGAMPRQARRQ